MITYASDGRKCGKSQINALGGAELSIYGYTNLNYMLIRLSKKVKKVLGEKMGINASLQKGKAIYFPSFFIIYSKNKYICL